MITLDYIIKKAIESNYIKIDTNVFDDDIIDNIKYNIQCDRLCYSKELNIIRVDSEESYFLYPTFYDATEYQIEKFNQYENYKTKYELKNLIKENDIWFCDGAGYYYLENCDVVDGKIIIAQCEIPSKI